MKIYLVGGSVRDQHMGLEPHDHDYVVVGSTPTEMEALGYKQVGKDFPVFLHPETGEEYALARKERKTGLKHTDFETIFDPSVTIEEDLGRRDLTINAIAQDLDTGEYIDPFNGIEDIKNKVIRHVSEAFKEDPLRVLRVARFAARFKDFKVAPETQYMIEQMIKDGELDHLSLPRIWQETKKAILSTDPTRFIKVLERSGGLVYAFMSSFYRHGMYNYIPFLYICRYSSNFEDDDKLMCRLAILYPGNVFNDIKNNPNIPTHILDFIKCVNEYAHDVAYNVHSTPSITVRLMDKMNIKQMIQKIPNFIRNFKAVSKALHKDRTDDYTYQNIDEFFMFVPSYMDTKDQLKMWMDNYQAEHNEIPSKENIKKQLLLIRTRNMFKFMTKGYPHD